MTQLISLIFYTLLLEYAYILAISFSHFIYLGEQKPDTQEPHLPYSLFSALCKEIRRLQSRSVSLVEALDLLSTGSYNSERLDHIKNLVFSSNQTKK